MLYLISYQVIFLTGKLSALIFTRNAFQKSISLVDDLYGYVDEIVIIDSSDAKTYSELLKEKAKRRLEKLRTFHAVALGYPDPLRMYALGKCRNRWVLLVDTDERISASLKKDLHKLIEESDVAAFSIRRYENVWKGGKGAYTNWQTRLFRKDKISFRGIIHEEPIVRGATSKLDNSDYFIDHVNSLRSGTSREYGVMERFLRMSYRSFNDRLIDHFYKVTVPSRQNRAGSFGGSLRALLLLYEKLGNKTPDQEISDFDYFAFYYLYALATNLKEHRPSGIITSFGDGKTRLGMIKKWQNAPGGDTDFGISKEIYRKGIIGFLGLDSQRTVQRINERFGRERGGVELLIKLLKLRYEKGERWLD